MTNYEKIKSMSINEMATLISAPPCEICDYKGTDCSGVSCNLSVKKWLESEAEEN